jgi:hypothetical protein
VAGVVDVQDVQSDISRAWTRWFDVLAYFGHHKCASTWIWGILHHVARETGRTHHLVIDDLTPRSHGPLRAIAPGGRTGTSRKFPRSELAAHLNDADLVSCITADMEQVGLVSAERGFHVIRDPRDLIVSAYFSHRNSHPVDGVPHLEEHRERLQAASKEDGLLLEMEFSAGALLDMADWDYGRPEILELKMERLTADPYATFLDIFEHLGLLSEEEPAEARALLRAWTGRLRNRLSSRSHLGALRSPTPVSGETLLGIVYAQRFAAKAKGRRAGEENAHSHYRKGIAGDWVNHFTPAHVEAFKDRFGNVVERLGYEDWGLGSPEPALAGHQAFSS